MPEELEVWKKLKDPELSRYEVSSCGNVKSLIGKEKPLKLTTEESGYITAQLSKPPLQKKMYRRNKYRVHRLVAEAFCEDYSAEKEVHHINLQRWDNRPENLICLTPEEHAALHKQLREEKKESAAVDTSGSAEVGQNEDGC